MKCKCGSYLFKTTTTAESLVADTLMWRLYICCCGTGKWIQEEEYDDGI